MKNHFFCEVLSKCQNVSSRESRNYLANSLSAFDLPNYSHDSLLILLRNISMTIIVVDISTRLISCKI